MEKKTAVEDVDSHDLDMVAFASGTRVRARNAVLAVDTAMQKNYALLKSALTWHLSPVIVVNNEGKGGEYTLIHGGRRESLHPISPVFELVKCISHVPLAIYCVIAPFLKQPRAVEWIRPLEELAVVLRSALASLEEAEFPREAKAASAKILEGGLRFIEHSVKDGRFSIESYTKFTGSVDAALKTNMQCAADAQVAGVNKLIRRWKEEIGREQWKNVYVVVLSIWTTSKRNQNSIILRELMDEDNVDTHLIDIPMAEFPQDAVAVALDNLARIVQDNVAAEMVFSRDQVLADSLKGEDDLLSNAIETILRCPYGHNLKQGTVP